MPEKKAVTVPEEFLVNLQGKVYVLYAGLLALAHQRGLREITTEAIKFPSEANGFEAIVKAEVKMGATLNEETGEPEHRSGIRFQGYGDASPRNVARHLATATLRIAETRAKARALRDATNVGITAFEELPDLEEEQAPDAGRQTPEGNGNKGREPTVKCADRRCTTRLSPSVAEAATKRYGQPLCPHHGAICEQVAADEAKRKTGPDPFAEEYRPKEGVVLKRADMLAGLGHLIGQAHEKGLLVHEIELARMEEEPNDALYSAGLSIRKRLAERQA